MSGVVVKRLLASALALSCPAQGYPVPAFRLDYQQFPFLLNGVFSACLRARVQSR